MDILSLKQDQPATSFRHRRFQQASTNLTPHIQRSGTACMR